MIVIGLTGGIASGKSTAARFLGERGAYVIDADKLGHRAYDAGTPAFDQVVAAFGDDVVGADGQIDRKALGGKVFSDPDGLRQLTDIVWPAIKSLAQAEIAGLPADTGVVVLEAAVLLEAGWDDMVDQVWVAVVDREVAITRATARDGVDRAAIEARIDAQLSNDERRAKADQVIDNSGDQQRLTATLEKLWGDLGASA